MQTIHDLSCRIASLVAERNRPNSNERELNFRDRRSRSGNRCSNSSSSSAHRPPSQHNITTTSCWYHYCFGARAQNCIEPSAFRQQNKLEQQSSAVAHINTTATGRLFITDKVSKRRFQIDTGSDLFVFPRKLIPPAQVTSRLRPLRGQWYYHLHIRVAATEP
jgi:hypothetical protein